MDKYKFNGSIDRIARYIEDFQLLNADLWKRFVNQFKEDADYEGGWRGEYWGKMMRGACFVYSYTQNPELYIVLADTVRDMLSTQDDHGRISSYAINHEFEFWDMWARKYVLLGMQYFLEICEDQALSEQILGSMCRQVDYLIEHIGNVAEGKRPITKTSVCWRGLNSSSILEPIVRLYRLTNQQRYLDFASHIVNCGGTDIVNFFDLAYEDKLYPYQYPVTKAYEMTSCFDGLLEYYYVTGEERYKTSVVNFANKILESDFTVIGGCGCTHELFDHSTVRQANTDNETIMQETCVTVTLMKFFYRLAMLTGESKYVDAFEISLYNAYLGAVNTEKAIEPTMVQKYSDCVIEPLPFDSYSPLTAGTRGNGVGGLKVMSDKHYYGCCACIGSAGIGLVHQVALMCRNEEIYLNLFIDGSIQKTLPSGNKLNISIQTDYPVSGYVKVLIALTNPEKIAIRVRIPSWSEQTDFNVNGEQMDVKPGYICLERLWSTGDVIEFALDMRTKCVKPIPYGSQVLMNHVVWEENYVIPSYDQEDPVAKNHRALCRGPIVLAQDNRLGYNVDEAVDLLVQEDGYVNVEFPQKEIAPYEKMVEVVVPLADGESIHMTDYASAGKLWNEDSKMAAWILVK